MRKKDDVPRELRQSGELCLAFANTAATPVDARYRKRPPPAPHALKSYDDLVTWSQRMQIVDGAGGELLRRTAAAQPAKAAAVFADGRELRSVMVRVFTAEAFGRPPAPEDFAALKRALARAMPAREVAPAATGYSWTWGGDAEALDRVLWPVVYSAAELLASDRRQRIRQCVVEGCTRLFLSYHRRIFCDPSTCGNRDRGKRYYRKFGKIRF